MKHENKKYNHEIRKEIMNAYHKLVLLLFYTIFALIVIFKSKELTKMSANHTILLFVAVFVLCGASASSF